MPSKDIKYLNKDFDGFKADLISYAKTYFPNDYKDFNETSTGTMLLETVSYVGDVLSFYLDKQFKETFIQTASERKNIIDRAAELGYVVRGNSAASAVITIYCEVDATSDDAGNYAPDFTQAPLIQKNSELIANNGSVFRTTGDVNFNDSTGRAQAVGKRDSGGTVTKFVLRKKIEIVAGQIKQKEIYVGTLGTKTFNAQIVVPEQGVHLEIPIEDSDVMAVDRVVDSSNYRYYETPYLAQDTVYVGDANEDASTDDLVPQVLRLLKVPRRFITRFDEDDKIRLIFGNGTENLNEEVLVADPAQVAIPLRGRRTFTASPINPENFTRSNTMGILPQNTTLTISYIKGGGSISNVAANTINVFSNLKIDFNSSVTSGKQGEIRASIVVTNEFPTLGGSDVEDTMAIRDNASMFFSAQDRCVTQEDFIVRAMTMPVEFGKVYRAYATNSNINNGIVQLYVLSINNQNELIKPSQQLKDNLKQYLRNFRILTDQIEILNGNIVNVGVNFSIVTKPSAQKNVVLSSCLLALKEFFKIDNWQLGQAIVISDIYEVLHNVENVIGVSDIEITNFSSINNVGPYEYDGDTFTVMDNTSLGIITPPGNAMFYVKYPNNDLKGAVK